jgi:choline dehydrogenase-like flavoprotein
VWIHLPIGYGKTMWSPRYNWRFETDPEPGMNGRRMYWPRGKTLGGSSSINGLIYIRGQREDYDRWAALGNEVWGWDDVLPYFVRSEGNPRGASAFHGADGPLKVSDVGATHELIEAFIDGAAQAGVPRTDDFNGASQEGAGYYQLTTHRGWRCSTAQAYLKPARRRPNLRIETEAHATRLQCEGQRVVQLNSLFGQARIGLQWLISRSGPLAVGINQGGCFPRALKHADGRPVAATPDIQFHVSTLSADMAGGKVHPFSGFTLSICQLRPEPRGHVRIRSTDPFEPPSMQPNYLSTDLDRRTAVAGVRAAREIAATAAMRPYVKREHKPGPDAADDAALLEYCRSSGQTIFHPSGTARMGRDPLAVVDARLRVHGVGGLRVVDRSVMPTLVSGNTNAPAVMMAEKAVDLIREEYAAGGARRAAASPIPAPAPAPAEAEAETETQASAVLRPTA